MVLLNILIIAALGLIIAQIFIKVYGGAAEVYDDQALEEIHKQIIEYRQSIMGAIVEHLFLWLGWDGEEVRTESAVSPQDQGIVRMVVENEEVYMTVNWNTHTFTLQLAEYDDDTSAIVQLTHTFKFKGNLIKWSEVKKFVDTYNQEKLNSMNFDELWETVHLLSEQMKEEEITNEAVRQSIYRSVLKLQYYMSTHKNKDTELVVLLSVWLAYISRFYEDDFKKYLQSLVKIPNED